MADLNTLIADLKKDDYYSRASAASCRPPSKEMLCR